MERYVSRRALFCALIGMSLALISCAKDPYNTDSLPTPSGDITVVTSQYPAVVMVVLPGGEGMCSGTFISPRAVLTAAHCALQDGNYLAHTSFGDFTTSTRLTMGPGSVDDPNDIALLIFDSNVADPKLDQVYPLGNSVNVDDVLRLIGFGCDNISTRADAGVKRTGTNAVARLSDYIEFLTPATVANGGKAILGPENRAGSCFGDSGGPALAMTGNTLSVVGVTHAGGTTGSNLLSEYVNVATKADNRSFLANANSHYNLGIVGL